MIKNKSQSAKNSRKTQVHTTGGPLDQDGQTGRPAGIRGFLCKIKKRKSCFIALFCVLAACFFTAWDISYFTQQYALNKQEKLAVQAAKKLQEDLELPGSMWVSEAWLNYLGGQVGVSITYCFKQEGGGFAQRTQILYYEGEAFRDGPCTYTEEELLEFKRSSSAEEYIGKTWSVKETQLQTDRIKANGGLKVEAEKINRFLHEKQAALSYKGLPAWLEWYLIAACMAAGCLTG